MAADGRRWLLIALIALSQFASAFMHAIVGVPLPTMARELGASGLELSLLDTVFLGAAAALLMPIGRFADVTDKNSLFKWGLAGLAIATFAIGLQPTMGLIIACRFLQAVAASFVIATSMAIVADIAPRDQIGRMVGLAIGATYIGLASGPYFAGLVTTHLGWRWVFFLAAIPPLASYALSRFTLPSRWRPPTAPVNFTNSALLAAAIAALIAASATIGRGAVGYILFAVAAVFVAVYVAAERRSANPLLRFGAIVANRRLSQALLVQFLVYCGTVGTSFLLSIYLQVIRGHTPEGAGEILIAGPDRDGRVRPAGRAARGSLPAPPHYFPGRDIHPVPDGAGGVSRRRVEPGPHPRGDGVPGARLRLLLGPQHLQHHDQRARRRARHGIGAVGGDALARHDGVDGDRHRADLGPAGHGGDLFGAGALSLGDDAGLRRLFRADRARRARLDQETAARSRMNRAASWSASSTGRPRKSGGKISNS